MSYVLTPDLRFILSTAYGYAMLHSQFSKKMGKSSTWAESRKQQVDSINRLHGQTAPKSWKAKTVDSS